MKKDIRDDVVYGEIDLNSVHEKAKGTALKEYEKKKKGSESLQARYREFLVNTIDMKRSGYSLSNREKKISSEKALDEAVLVVLWFLNDSVEFQQCRR